MNHHRHRGLQFGLIVAVLLILPVCGSSLVAASEPGSLVDSRVKSMGFPTAWKPYVAPLVAWDKRGGEEHVTPDLTLGVYKDLLNPLMSPLGIVGEGYVKYPGGEVDGGLRLLAASRFFYFQLGLDYSFRHKNSDFLLGLTIPLRRGGPLGRGGHLRIDWLPGRNHSVHLGLNIPVFQPHMGKTRP